MSIKAPLEDQLEHLYAQAKHMEPDMHLLGLQRAGSSPNDPIIYFSDKSESIPLYVEMKPGSLWQCVFRIRLRGLLAGITLATPWVTWGDDTLHPRLNLMKAYAIALREAKVIDKQTP